MNALAYVRRSTDRQDRSLEDQLAEIKRYARGHDLSVARVFEDDAISGSVLDRPGLRALLDTCKNSDGEYSYVLVWDRNRLARPKDPIDALVIERDILRTGKKLVYVGSGKTSDGSLADDIQGLVEFHAAGDYLRKLSRDTIRGLLSRVEAGFDPGRPVPYGYDKLIVSPDGEPVCVVRTDEERTKTVLSPDGRVVKTIPRGESYQKQKSERATLVPGEAQRVRVVRQAFRRYANGESLRAIRDGLNARGVSAPRGGHWGIATLTTLLDNPTYAGDLVYNRRTESKFHTIGKDGLRQRTAEGLEDPAGRGVVCSA